MRFGSMLFTGNSYMNTVLLYITAESPQLNMNLDVTKAYKFRQTEDRPFHGSAAPRVGASELSAVNEFMSAPVPSSAPAKVYT